MSALKWRRASGEGGQHAPKSLWSASALGADGASQDSDGAGDAAAALLPALQPWAGEEGAGRRGMSRQQGGLAAFRPELFTGGNPCWRLGIHARQSNPGFGPSQSLLSATDAFFGVLQGQQLMHCEHFDTRLASERAGEKMAVIAQICLEEAIESKLLPKAEGCS